MCRASGDKGSSRDINIQTSLAFPICLSAYSYRLFKTFNRAPLNYSLEALCRFPGTWQIHICSFRNRLESIFNFNLKCFTDTKVLYTYKKYIHTLWSKLCMGYTNMNTDPDLYYHKSKNCSIRSIVALYLFSQLTIRRKCSTQSQFYGVLELL